MSRELANQYNLVSKNIGVQYVCEECAAGEGFLYVPEYISTFLKKYI